VRETPARIAASDDDAHPASLDAEVAKLETDLITAALRRSDGNKAKAAAQLDISERTLWYKIKKLKIGQGV
jgi:transcriptional regulator with PAS, ATPase and Fis domain